MQQNKRPTSGSQLGIDTWPPAVGLAVTIRGFHPQVPGWTPGLWKVLDRSSVSRYIELGFADFTLKSRVWLPDWEKFCKPARPFINWKSTAMQQNKRPTRASELRIEEWTVPLDLAVRIFGFHPRGASSTLGLWTILQSSKVFYYFEIDSMQQNKRPTSGSQLGIDTWSTPVGLAFRIRGFHPQVPGSTPGLWKVLDRSSVSWYIELGFADFTLKSHPQVSGSTPGLGKILQPSKAFY